jgi:SH3 domain protein
VRAELKINFRASPSPGSTALGLVSTGDRVTVVERRGSWARVQVEGGAGGWLPASALDASAPPLERLAQLEGEVTKLRAELATALRDRDEARARNAELDDRDRDRDDRFQQLSEENRVLRAGERWPYLVTGASILGAGMIVGALVRGWTARRMGPRIRF